MKEQLFGRFDVTFGGSGPLLSKHEKHELHVTDRRLFKKKKKNGPPRMRPPIHHKTLCTPSDFILSGQPDLLDQSDSCSGQRLHLCSNRDEAHQLKRSRLGFPTD